MQGIMGRGSRRHVRNGVELSLSYCLSFKTVMKVLL